MSKRIKIGADELILWLRKNQKAIDVPNDGIQGLGIKIHDLIVKELDGEKIEESRPSHWADDKNVEKLNLPKTSTQYEIEIKKVGQLYENLSNW